MLLSKWKRVSLLSTLLLLLTGSVTPKVSMVSMSCDIANDACEYQCDGSCDAGESCPMDSDFLDCDPLQQFWYSCDACIEAGGQFCPYTDQCISPGYAELLPNLCLGQWQGDCNSIPPPWPEVCDISSDVCPYQVEIEGERYDVRENGSCDAGFPELPECPLGSDCLDCDPLRQYGPEGCDACIEAGGQFCGYNSRCLSSGYAELLPDLCLGQWQASCDGTPPPLVCDITNDACDTKGDGNCNADGYDCPLNSDCLDCDPLQWLGYYGCDACVEAGGQFCWYTRNCVSLANAVQSPDNCNGEWQGGGCDSTPPPLVCGISQDVCPSQKNGVCSAGERPCPSGSDCFDCDPLQEFGPSCEDCIANGGQFCWDTGTCVSSVSADQAPEMCSGKWQETCIEPSREPSAGPSAAASVAPSQTSSTAPTGTPTASPTTDAPTKVPAESPTEAPTDSPTTAPTRCFSGYSTVNVKGKGTIRLNKLKVGDAVKTTNGSYSEVYSFSHKQESAEGIYLEIFTKDMPKNQPLEITKNHLIYVFDKNLKSTKLAFASDVKVGDFLVGVAGLPSRVKSIHLVKGFRGLYTPMTTTGDILVNGVLASSYTAVDTFDGVLPEKMLHWLSHGTMAPYRLYCALSGGCQNETYDKTQGLNPWISFLLGVQNTLLDSSSRFFIKGLIVLASAIPFVVFVVLGKLLTMSMLAVGTHFIVFALGYFIWKKAAMKESNKAISM